MKPDVAQELVQRHTGLDRTQLDALYQRETQRWRFGDAEARRRIKPRLTLLLEVTLACRYRSHDTREYVVTEEHVRAVRAALAEDGAQGAGAA